MRRSKKPHPAAGFLVFGVGVLFLALAPLTRWYVLPRVELTPLDENVTDVSTGTGRYFDANTLTFTGPVMLTVTRHLIGDVAAGEAGGVAVWNVSTQVDTPQTLPLHDPRAALSWTLERWVFDRHTNLPVHCCGETPRFQGNAYLKFPFEVGKGEYQYWSPQARRSFPVRYTGSVTMSGHQLYRFDGTLPATRTGGMDVPGSLVGEPHATGLVHVDEFYRDDGTELLVDPLSGTPIGGFQHPRITLRLPGSDQDRATVFTATFTATAGSERSVLSLVEQSDRRLSLARTGLPIADLVLGSLGVLLGILLLITNARRARRATPTRPLDEPAAMPGPVR